MKYQVAIKKVSLAFLFMMLVFVGCNKEPQPTNPSDNALVKNVIFGNSITTYIYDSDHRVIEINYPGQRFTFQYTTNVIYKTVSENGMSTIDTLPLNSEGLVLAEDRYRQNYTYDTEQHPISIARSYSFDSTISYLTWTNENMTQVTHTGGSDPGVVQTFQYFNDKVNTLSNYNFGMRAWGKASVNLLSRETYQSPRSGTMVTNYTYEYDDKGRVSKSHTLKSNGDTISSLSFTYY